MNSDVFLSVPCECLLLAFFLFFFMNDLSVVATLSIKAANEKKVARTRVHARAHAHRLEV